MPSFNDSGTKTKKKVLVLDILAFSLLYIFSIAIFYLLWSAYIQNNILQLIIYSIFCLVYWIFFLWMIRDIHRNYNFFIEENDIANAKRLESIHFLCADPLCPRCGGWYFSLVFSFSVTHVFKDVLIVFFSQYVYSQYIMIIIGSLLFLFATPIHGTITFLRKFHRKMLYSKKIKLILGLVSGLSLMLITMGILMII